MVIAGSSRIKSQFFSSSSNNQESKANSSPLHRTVPMVIAGSSRIKSQFFSSSSNNQESKANSSPLHRTVPMVLAGSSRIKEKDMNMLCFQWRPRTLFPLFASSSFSFFLAGSTRMIENGNTYEEAYNKTVKERYSEGTDEVSVLKDVPIEDVNTGECSVSDSPASNRSSFDANYLKGTISSLAKKKTRSQATKKFKLVKPSARRVQTVSDSPVSDHSSSDARLSSSSPNYLKGTISSSAKEKTRSQAMKKFKLIKPSSPLSSSAAASAPIPSGKQGHSEKKSKRGTLMQIQSDTISAAKAALNPVGYKKTLKERYPEGTEVSVFKDVPIEDANTCESSHNLGCSESEGICSALSFEEACFSSFDGLNRLDSLVSLTFVHPEVHMGVRKSPGKDKYSVQCLYAHQFHSLEQTLNKLEFRSNLVTYRGPTMVSNTLHAGAILLKEAGDWDWFINLSAYDYPALVTQDDMLHTLSSIPKDLNFIKHTRDIGWNDLPKQIRAVMLKGKQKGCNMNILSIHQPSLHHQEFICKNSSMFIKQIDDDALAIMAIGAAMAASYSKQRAIILSIHQPSYRIVSNLLILSHGSVVHYGSLHYLEKTINKLGFRFNLVTYKGPTMVSNNLHTAGILLKDAGDWDWFINLSASDYPLVTQDDMRYTMSSIPRDLNFIEHTRDIGGKEFQRAKPVVIDPGLYILQKYGQRLSKSFCSNSISGKQTTTTTTTHVACLINTNVWMMKNVYIYEHWPYSLQKSDVFWFSEKKSVTTAYKLFTGSAWMMLSRPFIEYCIWGWDNLPRMVLMYYANFLSSPEGYFRKVHEFSMKPQIISTLEHYYTCSLSSIQHTPFLRPRLPTKPISPGLLLLPNGQLIVHVLQRRFTGFHIGKFSNLHGFGLILSLIRILNSKRRILKYTSVRYKKKKKKKNQRRTG